MLLFGKPGHELSPGDGAEVLQRLEHRMGSRQKMEAPGTPIGWMRPALQHSRRFKTIDDTSNRDRLDFEQFGKRALANAFIAIEERQYLPLRSRHSGAAAILLEAFFEHPRDVDQQESDGGLVVLHNDGQLIIRMLMISSHIIQIWSLISAWL